MKNKIGLVSAIIVLISFISCHSEDYKETKEILKNGDDDSIVRLFEEELAENHQDCLKLIMKKDFATTITHSDGRNLLMSACKNANFEIAGKLIEKGININTVDNNGHNALFYLDKSDADNEKIQSLFNLLVFNKITLEKTSTEKAPIEYCNNEYLIELLINEGVNLSDDFLIKSMTKGSVPIITSILKAGIDPNAIILVEGVPCPLFTIFLARGLSYTDYKTLIGLFFKYGADFNYGANNSPYNFIKRCVKDEKASNQIFFQAVYDFMNKCFAVDKILSKSLSNQNYMKPEYSRTEEQIRKEFKKYTSEYSVNKEIPIAIPNGNGFYVAKMKPTEISTYDFDGNEIYNEGINDYYGLGSYKTRKKYDEKNRLISETIEERNGEKYTYNYRYENDSSTEKKFRIIKANINEYTSENGIDFAGFVNDNAGNSKDILEYEKVFNEDGELKTFDDINSGRREDYLYDGLGRLRIVYGKREYANYDIKYEYDSEKENFLIKETTTENSFGQKSTSYKIYSNDPYGNHIYEKSYHYYRDYDWWGGYSDPKEKTDHVYMFENIYKYGKLIEKRKYRIQYSQY